MIATNIIDRKIYDSIGVLHNDHLDWLENKSNIEKIVYEKTAKLPLNSNIFVNKQSQ